MKLLLITYYFPPCGGAAVQRWLRFIKALHRKNVQVTVITTFEGDYPYTDESLIKSIPPDLKVLRCKPLGFSQLWKALGQKELPYGSLQNKAEDTFVKKVLFWLRLNLVVPDMRIGWNRAAYKLARQELMADKYDCVITTGPPHSTHLIGLKLKKHYPIYWCTDFRDPWSEIYYLKLNPPSRLTMLAHKHLESKVLAKADLCYVVSKSIAAALPKGNKVVLYNGFDPDDFTGLTYKRADKFRIKYVGQLTEGQDISPLLTAISSLPDCKELELSLIGTREFPQVDFPVRRLPFLPHHQALEELVDSELLVLIINNYKGNKGMLTTKLFEYIASGTQILCIAQPDGEAEQMINKTASGVVLQTSEQISAYIIKLYKSWQSGTSNRCQGTIDFLDVNNQVEVLLELPQNLHQQ